MPQWRLEPVGRKRILVLRRFDRKKIIRIPFLSAMSVLVAKDNETHSYLESADAIRKRVLLRKKILKLYGVVLSSMF